MLLCPQTEIMSIIPLKGLLTYSPPCPPRGWTRVQPLGGRGKTAEEKQPICKTVGMFTGVLWFVVVCLLMSVKIAVMELVGRCHSWRRATSPPLAVKASDPRVLHPSSSSASLGPLLQKHRPTFRNASAIKPDGFNVPDPVVSNAISFNPICGEIALER